VRFSCSRCPKKWQPGTVAPSSEHVCRHVPLKRNPNDDLITEWLGSSRMYSQADIVTAYCQAWSAVYTHPLTATAFERTHQHIVTCSHLPYLNKLSTCNHQATSRTMLHQVHSLVQ
jgi:hypothetical protein